MKTPSLKATVILAFLGWAILLDSHDLTAKEAPRRLFIHAAEFKGFPKRNGDDGFAALSAVLAADIQSQVNRDGRAKGLVLGDISALSTRERADQIRNCAGPPCIQRALLQLGITDFLRVKVTWVSDSRSQVSLAWIRGLELADSLSDFCGNETDAVVTVVRRLTQDMLDRNADNIKNLSKPHSNTIPVATRIPPGSFPVLFEGTPTGSEVRVDGGGTCLSPCTLHLSAGIYSVSYRSREPQTTDKSMTITIDKPQTVRFDLRLQPADAERKLWDNNYIMFLLGNVQLVFDRYEKAGLFVSPFSMDIGQWRLDCGQIDVTGFGWAWDGWRMKLVELGYFFRLYRGFGIRLNLSPLNNVIGGKSLPEGVHQVKVGSSSNGLLQYSFRWNRLSLAFFAGMEGRIFWHSEYSCNDYQGPDSYKYCSGNESPGTMDWAVIVGTSFSWRPWGK